MTNNIERSMWRHVQQAIKISENSKIRDTEKGIKCIATFEHELRTGSRQLALNTPSGIFLCSKLNYR